MNRKQNIWTPLAEAIAIEQLLNFRETILLGRISQDLEYRDFLDIDISHIQTVLGVQRPLTTGTFPNKLHQLLERSVADGYSSIISWVDHGRAFKIYNQNLFMKKIC